MLQRSFEDHFHGFDLGNYFYIYHDAAYGLAYFAHAQSLFVLPTITILGTYTACYTNCTHTCSQP